MLSPQFWLFIFGIASIITYILNFIRKGQVKKEVRQNVAVSAKLESPAKIIITRESKDIQPSERSWKWVYAFSLNGGEKQRVANGQTIEFTTELDNNMLVGYGQNYYGALGKTPSTDSPYRFRAKAGETIRLVAYTHFNIPNGEVVWQSNIEVVND